MSTQAMTWLVILAGGLVSYLFRALPQLIMRRGGLDNAGSQWLRFFDHAAYAVIGGIVASALLGGDGAVLERLREDQVQAGLAAVAVTFVLALTTRRQIPAMLAGIGVYQLMSWMLLGAA